MTPVWKRSRLYETRRGSSTSGSLVINAPVFVDLSNTDATRATVALATLPGAVLVQGCRSPTGVAIEPCDVTASTHG